MGITAFIVEPGAASVSDLKIMFTDPKTVRDYVVVFSTNGADQTMAGFNGSREAGLIARPDPESPPWQPDLGKAAEFINSRQNPSQHESGFQPTSLAAKLIALSHDVEVYRQNDPRLKESRETSLPLDIIMVLRHRLHALGGYAINKPFCGISNLDELGDAAMLATARADFEALRRQADGVGKTLDIRVLVGLTVKELDDKDKAWTNLDFYNLVSALGIEPQGSEQVRVALINPACAIRGASPKPADWGHKRFFALETMAHVKACDPAIRSTPIFLGELSCSQQDDEIVDFGTLMPPLRASPLPNDVVRPAERDFAAPGSQWLVTYAPAPDAPSSRSVALVEQQGALENATIDFVDSFPGHMEDPKTAPGKSSLNLPPNGRPVSGQHAVFVRIKPDAPACRDGQTIRADIAIEGRAFAAGTPARLSVIQKVFACETIILPVATFTIP